ncbi:HEAT repeat domain-containing protein [bacterium]|nr:HEAT repeat domain-containing protein [bacterium]
MGNDPTPSTEADQFLELFRQATSESDEQKRWPVIERLRQLGVETTLSHAEKLLRSASPLEREVIADVLGGFENAETRASRECVGLLSFALRHEVIPEVLSHLLAALSHHSFDDTRDIRALAQHPNADVRWSVAYALIRHQDDESISTLIELSSDEVSDVRDWATFGIGSMTELDTPDIRQALVNRLNDPDDDTRAEAIVGLAERHDPRVLEAVKKELLCPIFGSLILDAAEKMASPELLPILIDLRPHMLEQPDGDLERAINACLPPSENDPGRAESNESQMP